MIAGSVNSGNSWGPLKAWKKTLCCSCTSEAPCSVTVAFDSTRCSDAAYHGPHSGRGAAGGLGCYFLGGFAVRAALTPVPTPEPTAVPTSEPTAAPTAAPTSVSVRATLPGAAQDIILAGSTLHTGGSFSADGGLLFQEIPEDISPLG